MLGRRTPSFLQITPARQHTSDTAPKRPRNPIVTVLLIYGLIMALAYVGTRSDTFHAMTRHLPGAPQGGEDVSSYVPQRLPGHYPTAPGSTSTSVNDGLFGGD
jgi:hypothetical protein